MTAVGELVVASAIEPWQALGLCIEGGVARIGGIALRFVPPPAPVAAPVVAPGGVEPVAPPSAVVPPSGLMSWGLVGAPTEYTTIDGLATHHLEAPPDGPENHPLGIVGFDHVVVMTSSLERTCGAIEAATGEPLRRVREAGAVRQGFHRLGELIVEVVENALVAGPHAAFWGFVWNVADVHDACDRLGPGLISLPRPAVQAGRFIATVRQEAGLGMPLALMTPPSRH
ncbi:MAG: hypothetical protein Q7V88_17760 [Actinomycetota bacterium]|nr:hypothetical protein [Actinomycetota bacterium]